MSDLSDADDGAGRSDRPALPVGWWHRGAAYAVGYTVFVALAMETGITMYTSQPPRTLTEVTLSWTCFLVTGVVAYCACNNGLSDGWYLRVIRRRTPYWYILAVAAVCGSLVGAGFFGFVLMPNNQVRQAGFLLLVLGGPLIGVLWLVHRPMRRADPDYDDERRPEVPPSGPMIDLPSLPATESFGRRLGGLLFPNAVVALVGPLGAGKTQLSRAIAEGLDIANPAAVTSPTFTLIHEYPARLPIFHFDAYRLKGPNEFLDLGVTEYFEAGGVCLIEWADKVESALPAERLTIRIEVVDENRRRIEVAGVGERYVQLANTLASVAA